MFVGDEVEVAEEDVVDDDEAVSNLMATPGVISRTVPLVLLHVTSVSFPHHQYAGALEPVPSVQGYRFAQFADSARHEN